MTTRSVLRIIIVLVFFFVESDALGDEGCYSENRRQRSFSIAPGNYDPTTLTPAICAKACESFGFIYTALSQGQYCFCGESPPNPANRDDFGCTDVCSGDPAMACGSRSHVSVYSTSFITDLKISVTDGMVETHSTAMFNLEVGAAPADVTFQMDYGDGAARTEKNATDMLSRAFHTPGEYSISLFANNAADDANEEEATVVVLVESPVSRVSLQCPEYVATFEEVECVVTVDEGTTLKLEHFLDGVSQDQFYIADPPVYSIGPNIPSKGPVQSVPNDGVYVSPASEFDQAGTLLGFELFAERAGTIDILILFPHCPSNTYCFDTNECLTTCEDIYEHTCSAGLQFCPTETQCSDNTSPSPCPSTTRYTATSPNTDLRVGHLIRLTIPRLGYQYLALDLAQTRITVSPGDIIGHVRSPGQGAVAVIACDPIFNDFSFIDDTLAEGDILTGFDAITNQRHLLKALISGGTTAALSYTFDVTGSVDVRVRVSNDRLGDFLEDSSTIHILEGINAAILDIPLYVATSVNIDFTTEEHTGSNVMYWWDFGDNTEINTTSRVYSHTYTSRGTYNVTVSAFNFLSQKANSSVIHVQDPVADLFITADAGVVGEMTSISTSLSSGSDYTCDWTFSDGTAIQTDWTETPLSSFLNYTFLTVSRHTISVTCTNEISSAFAEMGLYIEERISGLILTANGAMKNIPFTVDFTWNTGTNIDFEMTFDGDLLSVSTDEISKTGTTNELNGLPIGSHPLVLTASNRVSETAININFIIEVAINGPDVTASLPIRAENDFILIAAGDSLDFSVTMLEGTSVLIVWDFGDSTPDTFSLPEGVVWDPTQSETISHTFVDAQFYDIFVNVSNSYSSFSFPFQVLAIARVENLAIHHNGPKFFAPPAEIIFTFSQSSGTPPNEADMAADFGDGNVLTLTFDLTDSYTHVFMDSGEFTVSVNVSNLVSWQELTTAVSIVEPIEHLQIITTPTHAVFGEPVEVAVAMFRGGTGAEVTLTWTFGDGSSDESGQRTGMSPDGQDIRLHTYTTLGNYIITVKAESTLETIVAENDITCQYPVSSDFQLLTPPNELDFAITNTMDYTLTYSGSPLPTDAFLYWDYGDGTALGPDTFSVHITVTGGQASFKHTYTEAGDYQTTLLISNLVSLQSVTVMSGIYSDVVDLAVIPMYTPLIPIGSPDLEGLGSSKNQFPWDRNVKFHMSMTQGTVVLYVVDAVSSTDTFSCNFTTADLVHSDVIEVEFPVSGAFAVTIEAQNPLHSALITTNVEIIEPIKEIRIDDSDLNIGVGQEKPFDISFGMVGTKSCSRIDYGDRNMEMYGDNVTCMASQYGSTATYVGPLTNPLLVRHTYHKMGSYNFNVHGFNILSSEVKMLIFAISTIDCSNPIVNIKDKKENFWDPIKIQKSSRLHAVGISIINCNFTLKNIKLWTVQKIDQNTGTVLGNIDISDLPSRASAELVMPPKLLPLGLYMVLYSIAMDPLEFSNGEVYFGEARTYIEIVKSNLVVRMFAGGMTQVRLGSSTEYRISPIHYSYDPDVDVESIQLFDSMSWMCKIVDSLNAPLPVEDASGCFINGDADIGINSEGSIHFDTSVLKVNNIYEFYVTVEKDTRLQNAIGLVEVVGGDPPSVGIRCLSMKLCSPQPHGQVILRSARLGLLGSCLSGCNRNTKFIWRLYVEEYRWTWMEVPDLNALATGIATSELAISKDIFLKFPDAKKFQIRFYATLEDGTEGVAYMTLLVNDPPIKGTCSIDPLEGMAVETVFTVECHDWFDDDGLDMYEFYSMFKDSQSQKQIVIGREMSYQALLPLGPSGNNFLQDIYVQVTDSFGASSDLFIATIKVNPIAEDKVKEELIRLLSGSHDEIDEVFARGDLNEINMVAKKWGSMMELTKYYGIGTASAFAPTEIGPGYENRTGAFVDIEDNDKLMEKYEEERDNRAQYANEIVKALKTVTMYSVSAIKLTGSSLATLTQNSIDCFRECQQGSTALITTMADVLDDLASESTKEEIDKAVSGLVACIGNILEASEFHATHPTNTDKKDVEDKVVYDTDMDSEQDSVSNSVTTLSKGEDALLVITNKDIQKTALRDHFPVHIKCFLLIHNHPADKSSGMRDVIGQVLRKIRNAVMKNSVVGEEASVFNSPKLSLRLEKQLASKIGGKDIVLGEGGYKLPAMDSLVPGMDPDTAVVIEASSSVFKTNSNTKKSKDLSPFSGAVTISIFTESGIPIVVKDAEKRVSIYIPLDPFMPLPDAVYTEPFIPPRPWEYMFYHTFDLTSERGSIHLQFRLEDVKVQLLVLIKLGMFPNVTTGDFDFMCMIPNRIRFAGTYGNAATADPYTCFIDSDYVNGFQGKVYAGIRQMQPEEHDLFLDRGSLPVFQSGLGLFTTNYTAMVFSASCKYFDTVKNDWSFEGCTVGPLTTTETIQCLCTHLTMFAGGWVVAPNTIDWNFVFSNMDFYKNPTLYITEIIIAVLYIVALIWARRKDKKTLTEMGITPLKDNDPREKYYYEIIIQTGMRRNAGTDSKVHFVLSGEYEETDVRIFKDDKRKICRRGATDCFLMSSARPLGTLNFIRIWHDNSGKGKFASWYLSYLMVRDVQTDERFFFVCNRWLAVEEDDGQVDRIVPVAGREQVAEFGHQFMSRTSKDLSDGHLWFSVVARPPQSRFTTVQRVSCCLCLLFMTMLTNAMFYEKEDVGTGQNVLTFGPFALTPEQISIGIISNLIVFPINFLIIVLFRKSRPRKKRPSRIEQALKLSREKSATSMTDVRPTVHSARTTSVSPTTLLEAKGHPETQMSRQKTDMFEEDTGKKKNNNKKKFDLPWVFCIVGWVMLWLAVLLSIAFVTFYGVMFEDIKCKKWITSMLISFLTSILVTQPIKVILVAIFLSLIVKNPGQDEDETEDEEEPSLNRDEEYLHQCEEFGAARPKEVGYKPLDPRQLEQAREQRMKEIKMWSVIREIVFYCFFLWVLMVVSYRNRSPDAFFYKHSLEKVFIITNDTNHWFMKVQNIDDFWLWAKSGLVRGIRAGLYYNGDPPVFLRGFINDKVSRIIGHATMRQLRVKQGSCKLPLTMTGLISECNDEYDISVSEEADYGVGWELLTGNRSVDKIREEYLYQTSSALDGYPYWGQIAVYSGGGYTVRLTGSEKNLLKKINQLETEKWIDRYTRAIFVEFTVYNPQINLFAIATLLMEFRPSAGIFPSYRFEPAMLLPYMSSVMLFQIVCEIIYLIFTLFFVGKEMHNIWKQKCSYFKQFWNLIEFAICCMSVSAIVIYFYRLVVTNQQTARFRETRGYAYQKFQYVGYWSELFTYMIGWLVFFASLKFLKLLRFNKKMSLLASTLKNSVRDLMYFSVIFAIVFLAFIQLFHLIYLSSIPTFGTFVSSVESGILMMMGKFDIYSMLMVEPILTQLSIFFFVVAITFIIVNMFLSILNETFGSVRNDILKQNNDYEIVDFIVSRFKLWTGLGIEPVSGKPNVPAKSTPQAGRSGAHYSIESQIDNFPERMDKFLASLSHMYIDKSRLDALFEKAAQQRETSSDSHPLPNYDHLMSQTRTPVKIGLTDVHTH